MNILHTVVFTAALVVSILSVAQADSPPDVTSYKQKLHDCQTQMKTDHPDMNHDARRTACRKQLGPMPKSSTAAPVTPAASPPPAQ